MCLDPIENFKLFQNRVAKEYDAMALEFNFHIIDSTKSIAALHEEVINIVSNDLGKNFSFIVYQSIRLESSFLFVCLFFDHFVLLIHSVTFIFVCIYVCMYVCVSVGPLDQYKQAPQIYNIFDKDPLLDPPHIRNNYLHQTRGADYYFRNMLIKMRERFIQLWYCEILLSLVTLFF
jgi:ABC-type proline/glycine betaine transport system permease subunit